MFPRVPDIDEGRFRGDLGVRHLDHNISVAREPVYEGCEHAVANLRKTHALLMDLFVFISFPSELSSCIDFIL